MVYFINYCWFKILIKVISFLQVKTYQLLFIDDSNAPVKMRPPQYVEISGTNRPVMNCHRSEQWKPQLHLCQSQNHTQKNMWIYIHLGYSNTI